MNEPILSYAIGSVVGLILFYVIMTIIEKVRK